MRTTLKKVLQSREITVLGLIIVLGFVFSITTEKFMSMDNIANVLLVLAGIAIASIGMTMVIITGGIDVSVGSILGMASVVAGKLLQMEMHNSIVVLAALGVGCAIGLLNGLIISFGNVPPIIVTLGMMSMMRALLFTVLGGRWIAGVPASIRVIGLGKVLELPIPIWIAIALIALLSMFLVARPLGRAIYAVGNNAEAARVSGVNLHAVNLFVYAMTGLFVGLSGLIYVARTAMVQTNSGVGFELDVIAAVVLGGTSILGGKGTIIGSFLGAALIGVIKNGMVLMNVPALSEGLVIGILILISVVIDIVRVRGERR
jgi:ribose/xylose/arabinose/galactoside ABC-type transport system permease subunit